MPLPLIPTALAVATGVGIGSVLDGLGNILSKWSKSVLPVEFGTWDELANQYVMGLLNAGQFATLARYQGHDLTGLDRTKLGLWRLDNGEVVPRNIHSPGGQAWYVPNLQARLWTPNLADVIMQRRLGRLRPSTAKKLYELNGIINSETAELAERMTEQVPPVTDLIRFVVREGWNKELLDKFGFQNEYPVEIEDYLRAQGLHWKSNAIRPAGFDSKGNRFGEDNATWGELYWFAHWDNPSLSQGYEYLHRLYPGSDYGPSPDWKQGLEFEGRDLELLQKTIDIPVYWRKRNEAISYHPLTRVDVRRMHALNVLDDAGVYHAYRAIGYNDANAKHLLEFTKVYNARAKQKKVVTVVKQTICESFTLGIMDENEARGELQKGGLTVEDSIAVITDCKYRKVNKQVREALASIRRSYFLGAIDREQARAALNQIGITADAIAEYLSLWSIQLDLARRTLSAEKNLSLFKQRLIQERDLDTRLQTLGFSGIDVTLMITEVKHQMEQLALKQQAKLQSQLAKEQEKALRELEKERLTNARKAEKAVERAAKERERLAKEATANAEKAANKALAPFTERNVKEWWKARLMNEEQIRSLWSAKGWHQEAIDNWIEVNSPDNQEE